MPTLMVWMFLFAPAQGQEPHIGVRGGFDTHREGVVWNRFFIALHGAVGFPDRSSLDVYAYNGRRIPASGQPRWQLGPEIEGRLYWGGRTSLAIGAYYSVRWTSCDRFPNLLELGASGVLERKGNGVRVQASGRGFLHDLQIAGTVGQKRYASVAVGHTVSFPLRSHCDIVAVAD